MRLFPTFFGNQASPAIASYLDAESRYDAVRQGDNDLARKKAYADLHWLWARMEESERERLDRYYRFCGGYLA